MLSTIVFPVPGGPKRRNEAGNAVQDVLYCLTLRRVVVGIRIEPCGAKIRELNNKIFHKFT